jgi:bifunctional non-homologous end joining protein LigD
MNGYRLQVRRVGDQVRLFTRRGYDWSGRYPAIAVTATLLRARSFTIDGEAVVCGTDVAIFDALHRRGTVTEAMLYAFDLLELDGEDLRVAPERPQEAPGEVAGRAPARHRAQRPHRLRRRYDLRHACRMGLEGIVSKRLTAPYRSGPSRDWLKIKNPNNPAMIRAREVEW